MRRNMVLEQYLRTFILIHEQQAGGIEFMRAFEPLSETISPTRAHFFILPKQFY